MSKRSSEFTPTVLCVLVVATGLCTARSSQAQESDQGPAASKPVELEEVVVTASKREEKLQDVPSGITALKGDTLQNLAITNFQEYMPYVPGLESFQGGSGIPGDYQIILRGLSSGAVQTTPTVGYYLDDTPITPNSANSTFGVFAPDPDLGDVDHIEVLKGPQATLYGASTLGGLIKIVSKKPDLESFGGDFRAGGVTTTDGGSGYLTHAGVNIPLIQDSLAVRLSAYEREDPGFTDNVQLGDTNVNGVRSRGGRLDLRYVPIERLDIELSALIQNKYADGNTTEMLSPQTLQPIYGVNKYSEYFNTVTSNQLTLFRLAANYDTGFGTLTNSLGFGRYALRFDNLDDTYLYGVFLPLFGVTNPSAGVRGDNFVPRTNKLTEELRFSSTKIANFLWQLGVYYTDEKVYYPGGLDLVDRTDGVLLPPPNPLFFGSINGTYREYAAFGDLTYYLTDDLDVTAGTRYSRNQQRGEVFEEGLLIGPPADVARSLNASDESYLFSLRWRPAESLSTYLRAASAYRPGGVQVSIATLSNAPNTFGPDTDWNYEVGAKGRWLDGRLNANMAVYYIKWRNIQLNTTYGGLLLTGNGGDAKSEGVEFDSTYQPVRGLTVGVNAAYDEAQMTSVNASNTAGARVGDPLPYVPKWSGGLTGDYSFPIIPNLTGGLGASWLYQGSRYSSFSGDPLNTRIVLPSYSSVSLRGHLDWNQYSVALNVDNLANKQTFTSYQVSRLFPGQPVPALAVPLQPRTVRLTLSVRF